MKGQKFAIYLDSLRVHKTKAAFELCENLKIPLIWAPIASPELNPIEMMFSKLKNLVRK